MENNEEKQTENQQFLQPFKPQRQKTFELEDLDMDDPGRVQHILEQKNAIIIALQKEVQQLANLLESRTKVIPRVHPLSPFTHIINSNGTSVRARLGRTASISTIEVLDKLVQFDENTIAIKFIEEFNNPNQYSELFEDMSVINDIAILCYQVEQILEHESRCLFLQSPIYVLGDIHGNIEDLRFFSNNLWQIGMDLTAGKFLFLGDYVDRGIFSIECVAYLFALKVQNPKKMFLLRGNHETRSVNGWEQHYANRSFLYQCKDRFGVHYGEYIWERVNQVFDRLPLAAVIDHDIFCVHGGIPRPVQNYSSRLQAIMDVPVVATLNPLSEHENTLHIKLVTDCIWSDPATKEQENQLDEFGFTESKRGGGITCYGNQAISDFLEQNSLSYVIRAHQAHADGVQISKNARVFTVFSTSKDHGQGSDAMAGCLLVDFDEIRIINRSPISQDSQVFCRNSISLRDIHDISSIIKNFELNVRLGNENDNNNDDNNENTNYELII